MNPQPNNLTPSLTLPQLQQNITALQKQGMQNTDVQNYVNNYKKGSDGNYVLNTPPPEANTLPAPVHQPGLIENLGNEASKIGSDTGEKIKQDINIGRPQDIPLHALQFAGNVAGETAKAFGDIVGTIAKSVLPQPVKDTLKAFIQKGGENFPDSVAGKVLIPIIKSFNDAADKTDPDVVKAFGDVINTTLLGLGMKAEPKVVEVAGNIGNAGEKIIQGGKDIIAEGKSAGVVQGAKDSTWKIIQPELTTTEQAAARKAGAITNEGLLRTTTLNPVGRDAEMLKVATPVLDGVKTASEAVPKLQDAIVKEATSLRNGLKQSKAIWNQNELKGALNAVDKPHLLSGDLEKAFDKTVNVVLDQSGNANKKLEGLLDVRQQFDSVVAKQYPNLYNGSDAMNAIKTAVKDTRNAINDLIESKLPEGKTLDGISYKDSLKKQSLLYDAVDNTATNAAKDSKVGSNAITRTEAAIKKHPVVTGVGAAAGILGTGKVLGL